MTKYRKKPIVIEAYQWFKVSGRVDGAERDVGYFRGPDEDGQDKCLKCGHILNAHGWIDNLVCSHPVCPGDYVVTDISGETYPCKPDIFEQTHEAT